MTNSITDTEILEYLRAFPDITFSEVARALHIERARVSSVAHKHGIYHRPRRMEMLLRRGKPRVRRNPTDLESERKVVEYIKSHPKESYTVIGKRFGYSPGRLSQIARDNGIIHYARRGEGEKTRRKIAKFLRKHPDMKVEDIAKILGYSAAYVSTVAGKSGLRRQAPKGSGLHIVGRVVRKDGARSVPLAPATSALMSVRQPPANHDLDREIRQTQQTLQQAEQTLQQLRAQKALLEIRVEEDGDIITIYGVGEPIARQRSDWLRWLKANGAAELRSKLEQARGAKLG
jgi:DNA-binding transcriptional ArsR family regulator